MRSLIASNLACLLALGLGCAPPSTGPASRPRSPAPALPSGLHAPGGPGEVSTWTSGAKEGVGTSATTASRLWFTLQGGLLTEVYYPRLDQANVRSLELAVSDGREVWPESGLSHTIAWAEEGALLHRQTSRHPRGRFALHKTTLTDPARETLLVEVELETAEPGLTVFALYDPSLANTCTGDSGHQQGEALVATEGEVATALVGAPAFARLSTGYQGSSSDGRIDLLRHGRLTRLYQTACDGNILQVGELPRGKRFTLALGFGRRAGEALANARQSLGAGVASIRAAYVAEWRRYLEGLRLPADRRHRSALLRAAMVLRAHEDKTYRGAVIASMSIPWGDRVRADRADLGGYHLVWSRDLYHAATAFLALGDRAAAERSLDYLFKVQQRPDGTYPQNSWLDGRPYWTSLQMDEIALPLVLAWQLDRKDRGTWEKHVRPSADYLALHGPSTPQDRWEEESGYSPSTIAAEIAGLVCAAAIAEKNGEAAIAARYRRTADDWEGRLENWTVTRTGKLDAGLGGKGYYLRINDNQDPDDGARLVINNGGGDWDEREVVDAGFLELVRLGVRRADDPWIERSLRVVDATIKVRTPRGAGWFRYNHDGYGEKPDGAGYDGTGVGRLWPLLTGERGEHELARGGDPLPYLEALLAFANSGGMLPEQVWDRPVAPAGLRFGAGTGSATPLAWAEAQLIRLIISIEEKRVVEMPAVVAARYAKAGPARRPGRGRPRRD